MKTEHNNIKRFVLLLLAPLICLTEWGCSKEFEFSKYTNAVKTVEVSDVGQISATVKGTVITDNGSSLLSRGICYSINDNPTINDSVKLHANALLGDYSCLLKNLYPSTTYYVKAFATNATGTAYGATLSFTTEAATIPILAATAPVSAITSISAISGGTIIHPGATGVTSRGVCWSSTTQAPTIANSRTTDGTGGGSFVSNLTALSPSKMYYVRAYATNSLGTGYGEVISFTTTAATTANGVVTSPVSSISQTSANSGGSILNDGGSAVTARGVCYSNTTSTPTIANSKTLDGTGVGNFASSLTGLSVGTTYYVRAYATNGVGTSYGQILSFVTSPGIPSGITTLTVSSIAQTSAVSGGSVTADGGSPVTARGVCWSTNANPTIANSKTVNGSGLGNFASSLSGLTPGTIYYIRAYATNSVGTAYGQQVSFSTTSPNLPSALTTSNISSITQTTATGGGSVSSDGGAPITVRGVCWSTGSNPTVANSRTQNGSGLGSFSSSLTGLTSGTTYFVRAYATNSVGTAYGPQVSFTSSSPNLPSGITTTGISSITQTTAASGGSVSSDGGAPVTSRGVCWSSTNINPTIANSRTLNGTGTGTFTSSLTGLTANTTYYVRAYATNSAGTAYGTTLSFTTLPNLSIGQSYQGGVIAYIFVSGDPGYVTGQTHGIIATATNQSTGAQWGCSGTSISGTSTALNSGTSNTTAITNGCGTSTIAARICSNLVLNGYSDWVLPSRDELARLYQNRTTIGGFSAVSYWSSSQSAATTAWSLNFSTGGQTSGSTKTTSMYVRAVRFF